MIVQLLMTDIQLLLDIDVQLLAMIVKILILSRNQQIITIKLLIMISSF